MQSKKFDLAGKLLWAGINVGSAAAGLGTISGFLGRMDWKLDLFSHFRLQYFLFLGPVALLYFWGRRTKTALLLSALALANLAVILPLFWGAAPPHKGEQPSFRLLLLNVYTPNQSADRVLSLIQETNPDFIILLEINQRWLDSLSLADIGYAHSLADTREDNFGIAFFSKHPVESIRLIDLGGRGFLSVEAKIPVDGEEFILLGTHTFPPKFRLGAQWRDSQIKDIAQYASQSTSPLIVAGDLNTSSWAPIFGTLTNDAELLDSRKGFGIQPTWRAGAPFIFQIPLDHILVSDEIHIVDRFVGPEVGSDHLPVILDFDFTTSGK